MPSLDAIVAVGGGGGRFGSSYPSGFSNSTSKTKTVSRIEEQVTSRVYLEINVRESNSNDIRNKLHNENFEDNGVMDNLNDVPLSNGLVISKGVFETKTQAPHVRTESIECVKTGHTRLCDQKAPGSSYVELVVSHVGPSGGVRS